MATCARAAGSLILFCLAVSLGAQSSTDFTGHWRQEKTSTTQRQLDVKQNGRTLSVITAITNSQGTRRLEVKYEIGGPEITYTGLDGDGFRSSVHWDGNTLVFDTIEHEDGRDIPEKTVWTLSADHNALQADRESTKSGKTTHSLATYVRQP